ncbi:hypothetical protein Tco_1287356 [Tanacetum coccineum]
MGCDRITWVMGPLCGSSPLVGMGRANPYYTSSCPPSLGDVAVVRTVVTGAQAVSTAHESRTVHNVEWRTSGGHLTGRDTIQLEDAVSTISQEYLLDFTSEYGIPEDLHLELPAENEAIIHISQLSVIGAAKVSHFEISCRVQNIIPTLNLFRMFYVPSYNAAWMSFSKCPGKKTPQCYTKPLDSLKNWNNRFFWIDEIVFPTVVDWRTSAPRDEMPAEGTYNAKNVAVLNTHRSPIQKQPEELLCLVGLSRRHYLGDDLYTTFLYDENREMDLFSLIRGPHPAEVKTGTRPRLAHEVPLLEHIAGRVIAMDIPAGTSESAGTSSTLEKSPLDFDNEEPPPQMTNEDGTEKRKQLRRKRKEGEVEANAPAKVLWRDHHSVRPEDHAHLEETVGGTGVGEGSTAPIPEITGTPTGSKNISDPDPLSYVKPAPIPEQGHPEERELRLRFEKEARLLRKAKAQVSTRDQRIQAKEVEITQRDQQIQSLKAVEGEVQGLRTQNENLGTLLEAEADIRKAAEAKNADLSKELERLRE